MNWKFQGGVMEVGNSLTMVIPKAIIHQYYIKKGDKLEIEANEQGLFIKVKQKK